MDDCRECGTEIPVGSNFCSSCGAPQNEAAARALHQYTRRHAEELVETNSAGGTVWSRLGYALGWILVVAGLAVLPHPASGFLVFGGVVALPPVRRLLGRAVGHTPGVPQMLLVSLTSAAIGLGLFVLA